MRVTFARQYAIEDGDTVKEFEPDSSYEVDDSVGRQLIHDGIARPEDEKSAKAAKPADKPKEA